MSSGASPARRCTRWRGPRRRPDYGSRTRGPTASARTSSPGRVATPKRWRTVSSRCSSSWSGATPSRSTRPRRRPSTCAKHVSTRRAAPRSPISWPGCTATCSGPSRATTLRTTISGPPPTRCSVMSRRLELGLALVVALAVGVAIAAGSRGTAPQFDLRTSSMLSGPLGSRGVYDVLARLRVPVERRRTPLFDFARTAPRGTPPAVLVVLQPPRSLYAAELAQVVEVVRAGGRVVAAGSGGGITGCVGWRTKNEEVFLLRDSFPVVSPVPTLSLPPVTDFLKPWRDDVADESRLRVRGGPIEENECATLSPTAEDTLLRLTDGRPAVLRLAYRGGGSVTLTVSGLRRRLGRTGLLRPDDQRSWLAALELALPTARGRDAVRRLQRIITQPGGAERALAAAQAAEDVWEELRPATTRAPS